MPNVLTHDDEWLSTIAEGEGNPKILTHKDEWYNYIANGGDKPRVLTHEDEWLEAISEGGGGGGNPNYIETIEGTLANPWGSYNFRSDIMSKLTSREITCYISIIGNDGTVKDLRPGISTSIATRYWSDSSSANASVAFGYVLTYKANGVFDHAIYYALQRNPDTGDNITTEDIPSDTSCTLTIIHHPMPESGT